MWRHFGSPAAYEWPTTGIVGSSPIGEQDVPFELQAQSRCFTSPDADEDHATPACARHPVSPGGNMATPAAAVPPGYGVWLADLTPAHATPVCTQLWPSKANDSTFTGVDRDTVGVGAIKRLVACRRMRGYFPCMPFKRNSARHRRICRPANASRTGCRLRWPSSQRASRARQWAWPGAGALASGAPSARPALAGARSGAVRSSPPCWSPPRELCWNLGDAVIRRRSVLACR